MFVMKRVTRKCTCLCEVNLLGDGETEASRLDILEILMETRSI